jgi:hypothetical protein
MTYYTLHKARENTTAVWHDTKKNLAEAVTLPVCIRRGYPVRILTGTSNILKSFHNLPQTLKVYNGIALGFCLILNHNLFLIYPSQFITIIEFFDAIR